MADLSVAHYRVLEKIGEGGMGVVYRAEDPRLGRMVALKALPAHLCADPAHRRRFQQEARAAAALNHNAIATIYDLEQDGDDLYIVMEYVEGETLRAVLREGPMPLATLISIAIQVVQGLAAAHERGIVHRDLKPENVLRTASGQVKILDFGLCRLMPSSQDLATGSLHLTDPGMVLGTLAYMSPEQLEARETDHRTDIFSFGVVLYELATGVHPFAGASAASTIANVLTVEPIPLAKLKVGGPSALGEVIAKCMRKKPEQRYQSVQELLHHLERARQDIESGKVDPPPDGQGSVSLLSWLSSVQLTPRRWWEGNQLLCLVAFPLVSYLVWRVRDWLPVDWAAILLASMIVLVAATTTMRMYLLLTAVFDPPSLRLEVRRWSLPLRVANSAIWLLLATVAGAFFRLHTGVSVLVWGLAIGGLVSTVIAEGAIDRKAFP
jgi:eukaryotic-like serine/threonine-protein kinase